VLYVGCYSDKSLTAMGDGVKPSFYFCTIAASRLQLIYQHKFNYKLLCSPNCVFTGDYITWANAPSLSVPPPPCEDPEDSHPIALQEQVILLATELKSRMYAQKRLQEVRTILIILQQNVLILYPATYF